MASVLKLFSNSQASDIRQSKTFIEGCYRLCIPQKKLLMINQRQYAKEVFRRGKPHFSIGTIGHVHHGKTTLTAAITKVLASKNLSVAKKHEDIDNTKEEQKKGLSMKCSFVEYLTSARHYCHVDCPGHVQYAKNTANGISHLDSAILVVSGADGVEPQTIDHLKWAKLFGLEKLVVFINKADTTDKETMNLIELDTKELLTKLGFNGDETPVIHGSALSALEGKDNEIGAKSIETLLEAVDTYIPLPKRDLDSPFMLPISNVFPLKDRGAVISGRLRRGVVRKGEAAELVGMHYESLKTSVSEIEIFNKTIQEVQAGDFCWILLSGVKKEYIDKNMILAKPETLTLHDHFESHVQLLPEEEGNVPLPAFRNMHVVSKYWNVSSMVLRPNYETAMPGTDTTLTVRLAKPLVVEKGQTIALLNTKLGFHGTGVVTEINTNLTDSEIEDFKLSTKKRNKKYGIEQEES